VGACSAPVPIATTDVGRYLAIDVKPLLTTAGQVVKLKPWCTPNALGVWTDNIPDGVIDGDASVELFKSSPSALDLADYRLCVNDTCLWLEGSVQPYLATKASRSPL
jgi:hypothetical protein